VSNVSKKNLGIKFAKKKLGIKWM